MEDIQKELSLKEQVFSKMLSDYKKIVNQKGHGATVGVLAKNMKTIQDEMHNLRGELIRKMTTGAFGVPIGADDDDEELYEDM